MIHILKCFVKLYVIIALYMHTITQHIQGTMLQMPHQK
jgi:hypothetical protein